MRETKFRAWDVDNNEMFVADSITFRENGDVFKVWKRGTYGESGLLINPASGFLMQYINESDKIGNAIYIGDIVKYHNPHHSDDMTEYDVYLQVVHVGSRSLQTNDEYRPDIWYDWDEVRVVGNIYENKDLLEEVIL